MGVSLINGESRGQENGVGMETTSLFRVSSRRFRVWVIWEDVYPGRASEASFLLLALLWPRCV